MTNFVVFININTRSAEFLSLFFDENLKKGIKGKAEGPEGDVIIDLLNRIPTTKAIVDSIAQSGEGPGVTRQKTNPES